MCSMEYFSLVDMEVFLSFEAAPLQKTKGQGTDSQSISIV